MKYIFSIIILGLFMSSCYKETYWLDDNVDTDGSFYPQIQRVTPSNASPDEGESVTLTVKYWSRDAVKQVDIYQSIDGAETSYSTNPYENHFDQESNVEVWPLTYVVPSGTSGKTITLRVAVVTEKDVEKSYTTKLTVN